MLKLERKLAGVSSIAISEVLEEIDRAAGSNARVLISGNATIRKEVIARRIHEQSARCLAPFVPMTCATMRDTFLGSGTTAHGGTLFLDEIGQLNSRLQGLLLTFVETGEVRTGDSRPAPATDVRIIAASSRDLHNDVITGRFSAALFYRLNIIHIVVPGSHRHVARRFSKVDVNRDNLSL